MEKSEEKKFVTQELVKSSMEILSELFSTFDAEPPVMVKKEKEESSKKSKKSKKKHKHKEKKHKKKSKKRKRSRSRSTDSNTSTDSGNDSKLDLAKILIKQERQSPEKKIKLDVSNSTFIKSEKTSDNKSDKSNKKRDSYNSDKTKTTNIDNGSDQQTSDCDREDRFKQDSKSSDSDNRNGANKQNASNNNNNSTWKESSERKIKIQNLKFSSFFKQTILEIQGKQKDSDSCKSKTLLSDSSEENNGHLSEGEIREEKRHKHKKKHKSEGNGNAEKRKESHRSHSHGHSKRKQDKEDKSKPRKRSKEKLHKEESYGIEKDKDEKCAMDKDNFHRRYSKQRDDYKSGYRDLERYRNKKDDLIKTSCEDLRNKIRRTRDGKDDSYWDRWYYKENAVRKGDGKSDKWSSKDRCRHSEETNRNEERKYKTTTSKLRDRDHIDKKKLLEIARKNAIQMMRSGSLPAALTLGPQAQEKVLAAIRAGGKTIEELTDFCKTLSKKEELGELSSVSEDDNDSDTDRLFHHPFQIKDRPTSIIMNIKNSIPLPTKTSQERTAELRVQFPVSSGQQHRKTENEWIPVSPRKVEQQTAVTPIEAELSIPANEASTLSTVFQQDQQQQQQHLISNVFRPQAFCMQTEVASDAVVDIGSIVSQRLSAMRKLQENPNDVQALTEMYRAQREVQTWAESKQKPGQFTGSTGAQILSQAELSSGYQAWAKKDQLQTAAPVCGGMGMHLLQKMGWKPGEGLGKEKSGTLEPLLLEVKLDKKGLVANEEQKRKQNKATVGPKIPIKTLEGKHPVSLLGEYAAKRKLGAPIYELYDESGPDHKKMFLFKVILNGIEYKPGAPNFNKKQAKKDAAQVCLQQIGLLPSPPPPTVATAVATTTITAMPLSS